ncbi:MAG: hypothetical protein RJA55_1536 [Acidobacteriota bacterium]
MTDVTSGRKQHELLADCYREFAALGFTRKPVGRHAVELAILLTLGLGGAVAFLTAAGITGQAVALVVMTLGNLGLTTYGHSASHNGIAERTWVNRALMYLVYGVIFGTSSSWWWNKHIAVHHATPNVLGLDDDVHLLPWFALTDEQARTGSPLQQWYYRRQWLVLPLALALTAISMMVSSWLFLARALSSSRRTSRHVADVIALLLHPLAWIALPLIWWPAGDVAAFYMVRAALLGGAVFLTAAPAHFPAEARFFSSEGHEDRASYRRHSDYILLQTSTTVNFRTNWVGDLLCCGSQYQIEHHLFPTISHAYYPQMSPLVRRFCDTHGYPYQSIGWGEGIWKSLRVFWRPKRVEPRLAADQSTW